MINKDISMSEFTLFRDYILEKSGILVPPEKTYLIETRLSKMMADAGTESFGEFYDYIISGRDPLIDRKIINEITRSLLYRQSRSAAGCRNGRWRRL